VAAVRFDGRVALVTGAGRGLGREFALLLGSRGAAVVVNDIGIALDAERYRSGTMDRDTPADPAGAVAEEIRAAGGSAEASHADVTDAAQVGQMVAMAAQRLGPVDIVINNAGIVLTAPFEELTGEMFSRCFDVHVRGAFNVARAAWSSMSEKSYGRILNICSVDGVLFGNIRHTAYDAAKGGLAGLTRGMAAEGAAYGIQVNGLLPGAFTRGQDSVDHSLTPAAVIDMSPPLVAPGACWLVHEDCPTTGAFFTCSSARMGVVFAGVAEGYQALPEEFTLETVREHWADIGAQTPYFSPGSANDYNEFRKASFRRRVQGAESVGAATGGSR
jgi:NAD(P)-dependent dehydrogenase (short-subunit alcohol dehydrogenase family)